MRDGELSPRQFKAVLRIIRRRGRRRRATELEREHGEQAEQVLRDDDLFAEALASANDEAPEFANGAGIIAILSWFLDNWPQLFEIIQQIIALFGAQTATREAA